MLYFFWENFLIFLKVHFLEKILLNLKNMLFYLQVGRDLIEEETAETDRVKSAIYIYYAKAIGVKISVVSVLLYSCFQVVFIT